MPFDLGKGLCFLQLYSVLSPVGKDTKRFLPGCKLHYRRLGLVQCEQHNIHESFLMQY